MKLNNVFENLYTLYRENKLAHAYLLETNDIQKCLIDLKTFVKNIFSKIENIDALVDNNYLPSLKIIETSEKTIKKDAVSDIQKAFNLCSLYTSQNIYVIVSPEKMNSSAYNHMLKFLEEPEDNIIGFFITNSKENIAPTILSRLEILKVNYHESDDFNSYGLSKEEYNEVLKDASEFLSKIELDNSNIILYNNSVILKKYVDKTNLITLIKVLYDCYHQKLFTNNVLNSKILKKLTIINDYLYKLQYNVNLSLLLSGLTLELGEVNE